MGLSNHTGNEGAPQMERKIRKRAISALAALAAVAMPLAPALAQVRTVDPDQAIDADIGTPTRSELPARQGSTTMPPAQGGTYGTPAPYSPPAQDEGAGEWNPNSPAQPPAPSPAPAQTPYQAQPMPAAPSADTTYHEDDLIGAAEGVFGKGAKGLADLIKDLLKKQGEPDAYIVGREAGGAFAVGLRYGSGTLHHKIEGTMPVYWTGPSIGFDAGANASAAFVLVYNLYDTQELFHRFPAGEGQAYLVGGFTVSYMRRGNVVLIPVRSGAGLRLGANVGYMKFSHKQKWLPF